MKGVFSRLNIFVSELFSKAKVAALAWKMVIFYFIFFTINSLGSSFVLAFQGKHWTQMDGTERVVVCVGVIVSWSGTMIAFLSQAISRARQSVEESQSSPSPTEAGSSPR